MLGWFTVTEAADLETRSFKDDMKEGWNTLRQSRTSKRAQKCLLKSCGMDAVHGY